MRLNKGITLVALVITIIVILILVGDYVDYDPTLEANTSDLTYTSTTDKTGTDSNQEFNVATYKKAGYGWRILGVSNGKIRLISVSFKNIKRNRLAKNSNN